MKNSFSQTDWVRVLRQGKSIYNFSELMRLSGLSAPSLRKAIHRLLKRKLLLRLKRQLYVNPFALPSLEEVAAVLYPPAYISLESALFMHGVMDQAPHLLTCVSPNKTRIFRTDLGEIAYYHIKKELFFGFEMRDQIALAWPEKAALDYIYLQRQNGIEPSLNEWNWENLDRNKLRQLATNYPQTVRKNLEDFLP